MKSIILLIIALFVVAGCSEEEQDVYVFDPKPPERLAGLWQGSAREGDMFASLSVNIESLSGGDGDVNFSQNSETGGSYSSRFSSYAAIRTIRSQITITMKNPANNDLATYNGSLDKVDTTIYHGNLAMFDAEDEKNYIIKLSIKKQ